MTDSAPRHPILWPTFIGLAFIVCIILARGTLPRLVLPILEQRDFRRENIELVHSFS